MTIFSPKSVGRRRNAEVDVLGIPVVGKPDLDAAVLRQPLLRDVELRHDLDARRDRIAHLHRRRHDVVEDAVDAVADAEFLLVGLDVDVARALLNGRHQDDVDELDDRRLAPLFLERLGADLLHVREDLDVLGAHHHRRHFIHGLGGDFEGADAADGGGRGGGGLLLRNRVITRDRVGHGGFRRNDRLDVVARHELDVVHGEHVRRIGHGDRQRRTRPAERNDLVFLSGLGGDELDDPGIDLELRQVDRGDAVLLAEQCGDLLVLDDPQVHEVEAELPPVGLLVVQGFLELLGSNPLLF